MSRFDAYRDSFPNARLTRSKTGVLEVALHTNDEFPASHNMSGGQLVIKSGKQRNLHWHTNANEWNYYLRGKGQVALFGSGGRAKVFDVNPGDAVYIPAGFGHAIRNSGNGDLEIVQTWDNGKFEEIDLDKWVRASPNYLLANNFSGVPASTISRMKEI
jgi:oxalate decarboxylase